MGKKIEQTIIDQIPILYEEKQNKTEVAKILGISVASVNKYLTICKNEPEAVSARKRVKITDEMIQKINTLFKEYRNMSQVAKELGISPTTVKNHLDEDSLSIKEKINDDRDALWYYIYRLFGHDTDGPVSKWNITQMQKFNRMGMNYKAQLLTLKYFYEVKKNPVKTEYKTIGIIPYVYDEASAYYQTQLKKQKEILEAIETQLEQDRIEIKYNPSDYIGTKKSKKMIDINSIVEGNE